jgi:hypothetical protein
VPACSTTGSTTQQEAVCIVMVGICTSSLQRSRTS